MFCFGGRIAPLRNKTILHAQDRKAVPVVLVRERADVVGVQRRVHGSEFDHHAALRQIHVQRVVGIQRAPVGRL